MEEKLKISLKKLKKVSENFDKNLKEDKRNLHVSMKSKREKFEGNLKEIYWKIKRNNFRKFRGKFENNLNIF